MSFSLKANMDIDTNVQRYLQGGGKHQGLQPKERYASFDYCYNYFKSFHEAENVNSISDPANMQQSCLQIGFYLASWGMLRGSTFLLQKSAKFYESLVRCIATSEPTLWSIDVDCYTEENLDCVVRCEHKIVQALRDGGHASATLVTKIMLGVYGNVPAFDDYFKKGLKIRWSGKSSLRKIAVFYQEHKQVIDSVDISTLDFATSQQTHRKYPKAKIIDMVGFIQGQQ